MKKGEKRPDLYRAAVRQCLICDQTFRAIKDCKDRKQKYCSMECYREARKIPVKELKCAYCGKPFYEREGRKKYCNHECYSKHLEEIEKGENSHFWKGGKTKESKKLKTSAAYRDWRMAVFTRDNFRCTKCGSKENLEAHHIKEQSKYPELRFDIDNGQTLCHECHKETDNYGPKANEKKAV